MKEMTLLKAYLEEKGEVSLLEDVLQRKHLKWPLAKLFKWAFPDDTTPQEVESAEGLWCSWEHVKVIPVDRDVVWFTRSGVPYFGKGGTALNTSRFCAVRVDDE